MAGGSAARSCKVTPPNNCKYS